MKTSRPFHDTALGAVLGLVGTFVLLNALGLFFYFRGRAADIERLDSLLILLSLIVSPVGGILGGLLGAFVGKWLAKIEAKSEDGRMESPRVGAGPTGRIGEAAEPGGAPDRGGTS
jgi:hypothetical protein